MRIAPPFLGDPRPPAYIVPMEKYPFRFDRTFTPMLVAMGVRPDNSSVVLSDDDRVLVTFGRWKVDTPLSNIDCIELSGPYRWYRAIGVRGSRVDQGLTFGSTTAGGVCMTFHEPIPALLPGMKHHPGLTVTVVDRDGLAAALESRSGPD